MQHDPFEIAEGRGGGQGEYAPHCVRIAEYVSVAGTLDFDCEPSLKIPETEHESIADPRLGMNAEQSEFAKTSVGGKGGLCENSLKIAAKRQHRQNFPTNFAMDKPMKFPG